MSILSFKYSRLVVQALILCAISACQNLPLSQNADRVSINALLKGAPIVGDRKLPQLRDAPLLALNANMLAFLDEQVTRTNNKFSNLNQLLAAIIKNGGFVLTYDGATRTAAETFATRAGNCLSFTNLFVAFARELNLKASYQEIDIPPMWDQRGGSLLLSLHVNALLLMPGRQQIVDFNVENFKSKYDRRPISDERATAHYYNNLGVEKMHQGDYLTSLQYFQKGIHFDPQFSPLWNNLGTLYLRNQRDDYAEASYRAALDIERYNYVAMTNLLHIYKRRGDEELAAYFKQRVIRHRHSNPYYRYQQAEDAFDKGNYDSSIAHLRYAIRKKPEEDRFYFLLGMAYLKNGNEEKAVNYLQRAELVALDDGDKQEYSRKLDSLLK